MLVQEFKGKKNLYRVQLTGVLDQSLLFGKIVRASFFFHVQVEGFWCLILSLLLNHEPHSVFTWNSMSSMAAAVCHSPFSINNWLGVNLYRVKNC